VAHLLGTTAQSVLRWVCDYVDRCCTKPPPGEAVVIELDEMWHFLQRKDNKVWIWKAFDCATGRLVDWECGDRDERTFRRLFERLARWKERPLVLAVGGHYQGKGEAVALERNNGQQRHWTAALRRRSIVVSKSLAMIERRVALFAHLHVNKEAAPEMYRLPIQNGRLFVIN
jgi:insertion element IS1 protein InsB